MKKVCVMGLGYIGLPTAAIFASRGLRVHGVDINKDAVEKINQGETHIFEPSLDQLVHAVVQSGYLVADTLPTEADVFILAVPTPFVDHHKPDISYIESAVLSISSYLRKGNLIILESTSPVGTTEKIAGWLRELRADLFEGEVPQIYIAHCPERVLPGNILAELVENDRVIGGINEVSTQQACEFYKRIVSGEILLTHARTAELAKLVENSFRDVNIAFANELSLICDKLDIDVWELIKLANRHPRVNILQPGPGVGGHCIAVDPWFIVDAASSEAKLIRTAREVNDSKPVFIINKIKERASKLHEPKIALFGLSFKADVDDLRESPALEIVESLAKELNAELLVVEPYIDALPSRLSHYEHISLVEMDTALEKAELLVMLVNHKQFYDIDYEIIAEKMVIDTKGIWSTLKKHSSDAMLVSI
ncbi:MAG: UDP-N-acetyl-D-mannosamine dehydrogenase [Paenibacillus sp.]|nr:UDP-N-acetyl-D-mannosamine dehydrogenase [Paenibacillus sp.]